MTANAEWKLFGGSDTYDTYIDYSRIRTEGRYKSTWSLSDYKSPNTFTGKQYKSMVFKVLIDCQSSRNHVVDVYFYSEQMGKGEIIYSTNNQIKESGWKSPPPNSIGDDLIKTVCKRK